MNSFTNTFELSQQIKHYLQQLDSKKIIIGFSGGPDSVATYHIVSEYYKTQGRSESNIILAHYDHHMREESSTESDYIISHYDYVEVGDYSGTSSKEADLRTARHNFFRHCLQKYNTRTLILGHNLTDRLETTLMNIERGSNNDGISNMQEFEKRYMLLNERYVVLRPLLSIPKKQIQDYCDTIGLHYFIDHSNTQAHISKRNHIRSQIINPLYSSNTKPLLDRRNLHKYKLNEWDYFNCEELFEYLLHNGNIRSAIVSRYHTFTYKNTNNRPPIKKIDFPVYFGFKYLYEIEDIVDTTRIIGILNGINEANNITKNYVDDLFKFIQTAKCGYKNIGNWRLEICHHRIFLYKPNDLFDAGQVTKFRLQSSSYEIERLVDTQFDIYHGKSINKRFINNKLPRFLRHLVAVDRQQRYHEELLFNFINQAGFKYL